MKEKVLEIIKEAEGLCQHLECDGTTRVLTYLLTNAKIPHEVIVGNVQMGEERILLHYWIELSSNEIVDLKARMWLKNPKAPHGVFSKKDTEAKYEAQTVMPMKVSKFIFEILTRNSHSIKSQQ